MIHLNNISHVAISHKKTSVKAVAPYFHSNGINFKTKAFESWVKVGGKVVDDHYPYRILHHFAFNYEIPTLWKVKSEARLRFVQPVSIRFDTFPDYACYEIIPFVWDCWPIYYDTMCKWLKKHEVKTAIFTSSQVAERIQKDFPHINILTITEGIDTEDYQKGKKLTERKIDLLIVGRPNANPLSPNYSDKLKCVYTIENGKRKFSSSDFRNALNESELTIALPRCMTQPEVAGDIETLTQRYWENMLSRIVMVGHAPKELTDLIGYNPVIELEREHPKEQILDILAHISDYQPLVDRNRETALKMGSWDIRMKQVMEWLRELGYEV